MARFQRSLTQLLQPPDYRSIRFRLTTGVVLVAAIAIGSISGWLNWRLQNILLASHQEAVATLSQRFRADVALYENTMTTSAAVQKVIDLRALGDTAIWVKQPNGELLAMSETLLMASWQAEGLTDYLRSLPPRKRLEILTVGDRALAICVGPLEVEGRAIGTLYVAEDVTQNRQTYLAMTRTLALISGSTIVLLAGLIALYVRHSLRPLKSLSTEVMGVTAASLNATRLELDKAPTEVKELAQALDHTLERLSQSWEQQRRLVGDVSHELRTPLTLVQGYLQSTLRRCHTLTVPQRDGLETAAAETDRIIRILNDLLVLARASMGHLHLSSERLDLKTVVLKVVAIVDQTGDRLEAEVLDSPLWVQADANALQQILSNLLDNAINYSPSETTVTIRLFQQHHLAVVQICDRGRGIPAADQAHIFEPFYRVDVDRSRATGGTGLGLAIVRTLVEKMHGTISVQSSLGEGSTFTVRLPICQGE